MLKDSPNVSHVTTCYHCGEDVVEKGISIDDKSFCCSGCKTVFDILNQNGLCDYYNLEQSPGINQKQKIRDGKFGFLDDDKVQQKLIHFRSKEQTHVRFYLPQMHCSSCIWLLENLHKVNGGILKSQVDFIKKEVSVIFSNNKITLRQVAELLTLVGYEPHLSLNDLSDKGIKKYDSSKVLKIGIAGFCFGNIMMLSFPEYFSLGADDLSLKKWFNALNVILSLPVFFYCSSEFFSSAIKSLKQKFLNIDAPIALAILITFGRSLYEILGGIGPGYLDSMSGIVFFMLLGRYFQNRTYQGISFERDYTSYFPMGVTKLDEKGNQVQVPVSDLKPGDRIKIHNEEIVPADAILFLGKGNIDYSFVSGESLTVEKSIGEIIYAGGKQMGVAIELEVVKEISQSYLTQLWNNTAFRENKNEKKKSFIHYLSQYFTYILFSVALLSAVFWQMADSSKIWQVVTSVLIVACPCALLLSATFTNGNMIRLLGLKKLYVKNERVLESIEDIDTIVFDKTGTITEQSQAVLEFHGEAISDYEQQLIRSLAGQSNHPLSKAIHDFFPLSKNLTIHHFKEKKGHGISGVVDGKRMRIGSPIFVLQKEYFSPQGSSLVYVSIDEAVLGYFSVRNTYRRGLDNVIADLKKKYELVVLSGDNAAEEPHLRMVFGSDSKLLFEQKPEQKLAFIRKLQVEGSKVIMVGDGLNDAGALKQSDVGIAISDNTNNFSPSCDAILAGEKFHFLNQLLDFCKKQKRIIYSSFIISILYNVVGLYFAVSGQLQPIIAAILMPVSSISIVLYTTLASAWHAKQIK